MATERTLTGKVAAITGGARGIGKATAAALVQAGVRVGIGDLDASLAQATAAELGASVRGYELDVRDLGSYEHFLDAVAADLGPVDIVINNAGIMPLGAYADQTVESSERQIGINIFGVLNGCRLAIPRLSGRPQGHIINIGSSVGKAGYPGVATYCGTKHFIIGFSEGLRSELKAGGIEVSCVMPSVVNTDLALGVASPSAFKMIEPEDVAAAVLATIKRPRLEVYVPGSLGPIMTVMGLMPRRVKDFLVKATGVDKASLAPDWAARAEYEQRAVGRAPGEDAPMAAAETVGQGSSGS